MGEGCPRHEDRLSSIRLFKDIVPDDLKQVASHMVYRRYAPGETLVHFMDDSSDVYYVIEGKLRATLHSQQGRETIFRDFEAGEFFGEFAAIDGQKRSASVSALQPCLIASQSSADFLKMLDDHHAIALALMRHLTWRTRALVQRVYELSTKSVRDRLYAELLRLGGYGQSMEGELRISAFPTHAVLANKIATHREAVTRELRALVKKGKITRSGRIVVIKDPAFLAEGLDINP